MKHLHRIAGALALAAGLSTGTAAAQDIKIGFNGDQSATAVAELGTAGRWGFEMAIEDINKAGGVLGRKLVGVIRDDLGTPPKSIQNVTELIDSEGVVAIVGPTNSGNALAFMHIPQQKKIPTIVPIATATEVTVRYAKQPQNYLFRISMVDREQIALLAAYAVKVTKARKIALIGDTTGYGQGALKDAAEVLGLHGLTPVAVEKFGPKDTDMTSQLAKMRDAGADVVMVFGIADGNAHTLKSMDKIGWLPITLGTWGNQSSVLPRTAGQKLAEHMILTASTTEDSNARAKSLGERIRKHYPTMTTFACAAQAYDSVMLLTAAFKAAGTTDGEKVAAALESANGVPGIIKTYDRPFSKTDHEGLTVADFYLARWKGGAVVRYEDAITKAFKPADFKK
ncbi:MAG: ABC transporter substrate-binding protein [Burkholderiales bacterium]